MLYSRRSGTHGSASFVITPPEHVFTRQTKQFIIYNEMIKKVFSSLLLMMVVAVASFAQTTTSGVSGRVIDDQKETLPGVFITARHLPSGTIYRAVTNAQGYYSILGMRPGGPYELEASYVGFEKAILKDIHLSLGETSTYNITMRDGSVDLEEVLVYADRNSVFNSQRTGAATNFSREKIETTPTISRSIFDIAQLTPQAVNQGSGTSLAGSSNKFNSFQIDGTVNNDVFGLSSSGTNGGQAGASPISLDAIEELQVVIAPFDVRQSGFTGGGINAITKSGTNKFHGSAYGYYNDQNFVGTTAGKDVQDRQKLSDQKSSTYGFTFGGPIIKNKLFFFTNVERVKEAYPSSYNVGAGSDITKEEADKVMNKVKELTGGYDAGGYGPKDIDTESTKVLARVDWNINDNHKFTTRYNFVTGRRLNFGNSRSGLRFNDNGYYMNNTTHSLVTELNSRFGSDISNEFRFGYTRVRDFREVMGQPFPYVKIRLENNRNIQLGTEKYSAANELDQDIFTLTDNLSFFKGAHTITVGTHNEFFKMRNLFIRDNFGAYEYYSINDFLTVGTPAEVLPAQYDYSFSDVNGNRRWAPAFGAAQIGFYVQDDWKVTDLFKLTYGLRADIPLFFDKPGTNAKFNSTQIAKEFEVATDQMPAARVLWSPRVGFRWHADEARKTLLRGGVGVFTGRVPFVWISNSFSNTGVEYNRTRLQSKHFPEAVADGFKFEMDPDKQYKPSNVFTSEIDVLDKNFKYPQVLRTNLAWEQRLPYDIKFTLEGIYSKTLNNILYRNLSNVASGQRLNNGTGDNRMLFTSREGSRDYNGIIYLTNTNKGYTYNISAKLEKDFDFGLSTMVAYTYGDSKGVNDGTSSQAYSGWQYNEVYDGDAAEEVSFTDFNVKHRVIASLGYRIEYAKNFATTISLFYNGQSGRNYSMVYYGDLNGDGARGNDLMYVPTKSEVNMMNWKNAADAAEFDKWIDENSEIAAYRGTYIPRNALTGPFEHHFDLHLAQDFHFMVAGQKNTIQLNFDILNVGNLLNRAWGIYNNISYNYSPVGLDKKSKTGSPIYTFSRPKGETLYNLSDYNSRWRAQVGLKYIF